MTFETTGAGVLCRLTLEEAERAQREGYLSITPAEDGELSRAIRAEVKAQVDVPAEIRQGLETWLAYKRERRQSYKPRGLKALVALMVEMGPERALLAVNHSIANNYSGLYEAKTIVVQGGPPESYRPYLSRDVIERWNHLDKHTQRTILENVAMERSRL